jgi:uncharacterized YceG family protein
VEEVSEFTPNALDTPIQIATKANGLFNRILDSMNNKIEDPHWDFKSLIEDKKPDFVVHVDDEFTSAYLPTVANFADSVKVLGTLNKNEYVVQYTLLVNGKTSYDVTVSKGEVVRFYLTNSANTRVFNFSIAGAQLKLIGNENTALKIASIIQREAAGKEDMRLISGIIWNRIFSGMKLQIDATLQYAKGSEEDGWWKQVASEDKKIESLYNTYRYKGLPPGAIANPGPDAIKAAFYPQKTDCLFYLHDKNRKIHCTKTYEEHKKNIEIYLK